MDWSALMFWSPVAAVVIAAVVWLSQRNIKNGHGAASFALRTTVWGVVLGVAGFIGGSLLPGILDARPGNLQFIVGLLFTGPFGVFLGIVLGSLVQRVPRVWPYRFGILGATFLLYTGGLVYLFVPYYQFEAYLIEGRVLECRPARALYEARLDYWKKEYQRLLHSDAEVDRVNRQLIRERGDDSNWEQEVATGAERREGVVLKMELRRKGSVYEGHWTTGRISSRVEWNENAGKTETFFADWEGDNCDQYLGERRALYQTKIEPWDRYPPRNPPAFLGLNVIRPVSGRYQSLIQN